MSETERRSDANRCFVCGPSNPIGLKIRFHLDDDVCRGEFTPGEDHVGYDDVTHGGILYSALDDVMANWIFLRGARGYTARCEVRYRAPLPVGTPSVSRAAWCARRASSSSSRPKLCAWTTAASSPSARAASWSPIPDRMGFSRRKARRRWTPRWNDG